MRVRLPEGLPHIAGQMIGHLSDAVCPAAMPGEVSAAILRRGLPLHYPQVIGGHNNRSTSFARAAAS